MAHKIKDGCHPLRTQDHRWGIGVWDCSCRYRLYNPPAPELIQRHTERPRLEPVDE